MWTIACKICGEVVPPPFFVHFETCARSVLSKVSSKVMVVVDKEINLRNHKS